MTPEQARAKSDKMAVMLTVTFDSAGTELLGVYSRPVLTFPLESVRDVAMLFGPTREGGRFDGESPHGTQTPRKQLPFPKDKGNVGRYGSGAMHPMSSVAGVLTRGLTGKASISSGENGTRRDASKSGSVSVVSSHRSYSPEGTITGIRSWIGASTALATVVRIVPADWQHMKRSPSPDV